MTDDTKTCQICFSEIDVRARKCPGCLHWQGRLDRVVANPGFAAVVPILFLLVMFGLMGYALERTLDRGEDFAPYAGQIVVLNSQMQFNTSSDDREPTVVVLAQVRNDSDVPWENLEFEARFYDAEGDLIDVGAEPGRASYVTIYPGQERNFRIITPAVRPEADYVRHELVVRSARDVDGW